MKECDQDEFKRRAEDLDDRLKHLYRHDALSNAYLRYYLKGETSLEEVLIGLVVAKHETLDITAKKYLHELQTKTII